LGIALLLPEKAILRGTHMGLKSKKDNSLEVKRLHTEIMGLLANPVDWETLFRKKLNSDDMFNTWLYYMNNVWRSVACKFQKRHEGAYIDNEERLNIITNIESLLEDIANIRTWLKPAKSRYQEKVRRFSAMKIVDRRTRAKHQPTRRLSDRNIQTKTTKSNESLLFPDITPELLDNTLWMIIIFFEKWKELCDLHNKKYYVDTMADVGYSDGQLTSLLCYNIDSSTPQAHAYPILKKDIPKGAEILYIDNLQGYHRKI
jgi:hypothetical protein